MTRRPPAEERRLGVAPVMRDWTRKAATISRQRRLDTRLGEMSCRDLVRVVKASSPDRARPTSFMSVVVINWIKRVSLTEEYSPVLGWNVYH